MNHLTHFQQNMKFPLKSKTVTFTLINVNLHVKLKQKRNRKLLVFATKVPYIIYFGHNRSVTFTHFLMCHKVQIWKNPIGRLEEKFENTDSGPENTHWPYIGQKNILKKYIPPLQKKVMSQSRENHITDRWINHQMNRQNDKMADKNRKIWIHISLWQSLGPINESWLITILKVWYDPDLLLTKTLVEYTCLLQFLTF